MNIEWLKVLITERLKSIIQDLVQICINQKSALTEKLTDLKTQVEETRQGEDPLKERLPSLNEQSRKSSMKKQKTGNLSRLKVNHLLTQDFEIETS